MDVDPDKIIQDCGYYDKNNIWNGVVLWKDKLYRNRVEVLILNDRGELFARVYPRENNCRFPGGSVAKKLPDDIQASNECKEEANIIVKNIRDTGIVYYEEYQDVYYDVDKRIFIEGKCNRIFIAEYHKPYNEYVRQVDRDNDMKYHGKFYPYDILREYMNKYQKKAYETFISTNQIKPQTIFYPYYTPYQMDELGIYGESPEDNFFKVKASIDNSKWYKSYCDNLDPGPEWKDQLLKYYTESMKNPDDLSIKQTILEFGWNPEINPFSDRILTSVSESTRSILNRLKV